MNNSEHMRKLMNLINEARASAPELDAWKMIHDPTGGKKPKAPLDEKKAKLGFSRGFRAGFGGENLIDTTGLADAQMPFFELGLSMGKHDRMWVQAEDTNAIPKPKITDRFGFRKPNRPFELMVKSYVEKAWLEPKVQELIDQHFPK
jgi:hypothetical protein